MRYFIWLTLLWLCPAAAAQSDPQALALADRVSAAMGDRSAFDQQRYLRFNFAFDLDAFSFRSRHLWDRQTGDFRVEWSFQGRNMVVVANVENPAKGQAWVNGGAVDSTQKAALLSQGRYRFLNETYWLLMPTKMKDPGTRLQYHSEAIADGQTYDILHLAFDQVGMTPGDQYWIFVNRETGQMDRFAYFLERFEGDPSLEEASLWAWRQWEPLHGLRIARERILLRGPKEGQTGRVFFPLVTTLPHVDAAVFANVAVPLPDA